MRKSSALAAVFSLLVICVALAAREAGAYTFRAPDPLNGTAWSNLNAHDRGLATQAILSGYESGWVAGYSSRTVRTFTAMKESRAKFTDEFMKQEREDQPAFSLAPSAYASRITSFYKEYPAARNVWVVNVLGCLADKYPIPCDQVAKQPE